MRIAPLLVVVAACSSSPKTPPPAVTPAPAENKPAETGPLSEAEFKALHAPPTAGPAKVDGQAIDLAGTKAYLSLPKGTGPFPAIVVIHEWWGLNANIEHWADRLASAGWAAIAVDLYSGTVATTPDDAMAAMKAVDPAKAKATIKAALDFAKSDPRIAATKRAVIGWCFGGGWSLQSALAFPELDGVIMYYGQLETDPAKLAAIKGPLLGVFGTQDKGIPPEAVAKFDAALKDAKVEHEIHSYDAPHAFANPSNPKYDETSAADAWTHVLAFLDKLKA
jgi:carboxymethylenebutenolidase